jgi:hypothetical protein
MSVASTSPGFPFTLEETLEPSIEAGSTKTNEIGDDDTNRYDKGTEDRMT